MNFIDVKLAATVVFDHFIEAHDCVNNHIGQKGQKHDPQTHSLGIFHEVLGARI